MSLLSPPLDAKRHLALYQAGHGSPAARHSTQPARQGVQRRSRRRAHHRPAMTGCQDVDLELGQRGDGLHRGRPAPGEVAGWAGEPMPTERDAGDGVDVDGFTYSGV
jgi:hypothetical protein